MKIDKETKKKIKSLKLEPHEGYSEAMVRGLFDREGNLTITAYTKAGGEQELITTPDEGLGRKVAKKARKRLRKQAKQQFKELEAYFNELGLVIE